MPLRHDGGTGVRSPTRRRDRCPFRATTRARERRVESPGPETALEEAGRRRPQTDRTNKDQLPPPPGSQLAVGVRTAGRPLTANAPASSRGPTASATRRVDWPPWGQTAVSSRGPSTRRRPERRRPHDAERGSHAHETRHGEKEPRTRNKTRGEGATRTRHAPSGRQQGIHDRYREPDLEPPPVVLYLGMGFIPRERAFDGRRSPSHRAAPERRVRRDLRGPGGTGHAASGRTGPGPRTAERPLARVSSQNHRRRLASAVESTRTPRRTDIGDSRHRWWPVWREDPHAEPQSRPRAATSKSHAAIRITVWSGPRGRPPPRESVGAVAPGDAQSRANRPGTDASDRCRFHLSRARRGGRRQNTTARPPHSARFEPAGRPAATPALTRARGPQLGGGCRARAGPRAVRDRTRRWRPPRGRPPGRLPAGRAASRRRRR